MCSDVCVGKIWSVSVVKISVKTDQRVKIIAPKQHLRYKKKPYSTIILHNNGNVLQMKVCGEKGRP